MDDRRFDSLAKAVASGASRRSVLKGILGLGGAAIAGGVLLEGDTDAARRPTPTPKPVKCPGNQVPVGGVCTCPGTAPYTCGPACCTGQPGDAPSPNHTECCDNACCHGACYGEELCCPTNPLGSEGQLPPLAELCRETNQCCLAPDFCCNIDGCCSTVCWGGNFDDDFCCPAEELCPGGGSSPDRCCTGGTVCCGAGTDENACIDLSSDGACCTPSDCGPPAEGTCGWDCSGGQCVGFICVEGSICCQGACVSASEYVACPTDPNECCGRATDVCCGGACCASNRCNAGQECCGASQFVCGLSCCETGPGALCCGGNTCCVEGKCAGGVTCCAGSDVACGAECCPEERCGVNAATGDPACCDVGYLACSGGICCKAEIYQCATDGPGCECLSGTEACGLLPGGCCPNGQCNENGDCCGTGTIPCGVDCCDGLTQSCNNITSTCECFGGLISCNGACIDAECCGADNSLCANQGFAPECVQCVGGVCSDAGTDFNECDDLSGYCSNGICLPCLPNLSDCSRDSQCCSGACLNSKCGVQ